MVDVGDVLGTKDHLGACNKREARSDAWIAVKNANVVTARPSLDDYPETVDAAIDDSSRVARLDVEQEFGRVAGSQALSFDSAGNPERLRMLVVPNLC